MFSRDRAHYDHRRTESASSVTPLNPDYYERYDFRVAPNAEPYGRSMLPSSAWDLSDHSAVTINTASSDNFWHRLPTLPIACGRTQPSSSLEGSVSSITPQASTASISFSTNRDVVDDDGCCQEPFPSTSVLKRVAPDPISDLSTALCPTSKGRLCACCSVRRKMYTFWPSLACVITVFVPNSLLEWFGVSSPGAQTAWRQKVLLVLTVYSCCACYVLGLQMVSDAFCNGTKGVSLEEAKRYGYFIINGKVVLPDLAESPDIQKDLAGDSITQLAGSDVSSIFPAFMALARLKDNQTYRDPVIGACITDISLADNWLKRRVSDSGLRVNSSGRRLIDCPSPDDLSKPAIRCIYSAASQVVVKKKSLADVEWPTNEVTTRNSFDSKDPNRRSSIIINDRVYDITDYLRYATRMVAVTGNPNGPQVPVPDAEATAFLGASVTQAFMDHTGDDATRAVFDAAGEKAGEVIECLDRLFYQGVTPAACGLFNGCDVIHPIVYPVVASLLLVVVAQLLSSANDTPRGISTSSVSSPLPKVVSAASWKCYCITLVRCGDEPMEMLRATIDNITRSDYDDSRRLLFIVCDGILGLSKAAKQTAQSQASGGDTARSLLDILSFGGHDPPLLAYTSLGEGTKQVNFAKVYAGFYECGSHRLPCLLMIKAGNEAEQNLPRPGRRGKRDTLHFTLNFLQQVFQLSNTSDVSGAGHPQGSAEQVGVATSDADVRLSPLEHELFRSAKDVLGIVLPMYQCLFVVDAGVLVESSCLRRMAVCLTSGPDIAAVGGGTHPSRADTSFIAALQVYKHLITNHFRPCLEMMVAGSVAASLNPSVALYKLWKDNGEPCVTSAGVVSELRGEPDPGETPWEHALLRLGEDAKIGASILRHNAGAKIAFEPGAVCYVGLPTTFLGMVRTVVRQFVVDWHRLVDLALMGCGGERRGRSGAAIPLRIRAAAFTTLLCQMLGPGTVLYGYLLVLNLFYPNTTMVTVRTLPNIVVAVSVIGAFLLHVLYHLVRMRPMYVLYELLHTVLGIPLFSVVLPLFALWKVDAVDEAPYTGPTTALAGGTAMPSGVRVHGCVDDTDQERRKLFSQTCPRWTAREFDLAIRGTTDGAIHGETGATSARNGRTVLEAAHLPQHLLNGRPGTVMCDLSCGYCPLVSTGGARDPYTQVAISSRVTEIRSPFS